MQSVATSRSRVICAVAASCWALGWATGASAQPVVIPDSGDSAWMLFVSLCAVLLPVVGSLSTARTAEDRTTLATIFAATVLIWALIGYSLAFGEGSLWIGGFDNLGLRNLADMRDGATIPLILEVVFQLGIAMTATMLVTAPFAGRLRPGWLTGFALLWLLLVHIPIARADSDGGWSGGAGTLDYAGALPMLLASGIAGIVVHVLGGRRDQSGGSIALAALAILTVIAGANLAADGDSVQAIVNALAGCAATLLVWAVASRRRGVPVDLGAALVTGLTLVASNAVYISPVGAMAVGAVGGLACYAASGLAVRKLGTNAADWFVPGALGAVIGMIALPVLVMPALGGPGFDEGIVPGAQFVTQIIATGATIIWAGGVTTVVALMVAMIVPMTDAADS